MLRHSSATLEGEQEFFDFYRALLPLNASLSLNHQFLQYFFLFEGVSLVIIIGVLLNPLILVRLRARRDRMRPWDRGRTLFVAGDPFPFVTCGRGHVEV